MTYALGHMSVRMNGGVLYSASSGLGGPNALVKCNAISSDMYNVALKNVTSKK